MLSYIIEIEFKRECEGDKTKWLVGGVVTSLMTGTLFGCTQDLPQNRMIIVVQIGIGMMNLGYGSVMIVVQVIVGITFMVEHTIKINPLSKVHQRLNRINRLRNLKGNWKRFKGRIWRLKYVAIHKEAKRVLFEISEFLVGFI